MTLDNKADGKDDLREKIVHLPIYFLGYDRIAVLERKEVLALIDKESRELAERDAKLADIEAITEKAIFETREIVYAGQKWKEAERALNKIHAIIHPAELSQNPLALSTSTGEEMPPRDPEQLYSVFQDASTGEKRE